MKKLVFMLLALLPLVSQAQTWPARPITIVVGFADRKSTRLNSSHG